MINITIIAIVMMALSALYVASDNMWNRVAFEQFKTNNRYQFNNAIREAYHRYIASINEPKSDKAEASWRFREALACGYDSCHPFSTSVIYSTQPSISI